jgi:hypothetical protein
MWNARRLAVPQVVAATAIAVPALVLMMPPAGASTTPTAPPGYHRVTGAPIPAPSSQFDAGGTVTCPAGTVVWGGGAGFTGGFAGTGNNINTSAPTTVGWEARYNNSSGRAITFRVTATCAKKPTGYRMVFKTVDNAANSRAGGVASCPAGTVLLSGGSQSTDDTVASYQLSAFPKSSTAFKVVMWNGSATAQRFTVFAICAQKPPHYSLRSVSVNISAGPVTVVGDAPFCPAGSKLVGGGVKVVNPQPGIALGFSGDDGSGNWLVEVVNSTPAAGTGAFSAICAA